MSAVTTYVCNPLRVGSEDRGEEEGIVSITQHSLRRAHSNTIFAYSYLMFNFHEEYLFSENLQPIGMIQYIHLSREHKGHFSLGNISSN